jgi:exodeoxyribonuclease VII small subunit
MTDDEQVSYSNAISELEEILEQIEGDDVDLDDLAVKVERASELVELCRDKIDKTEMQVKTIIDDLRDDEGDES